MLTAILDKVPLSERDTAHTAFQSLAFAYAILSDERRRNRYDTTGSTSESLEIDDDDFDWTSFFRNQFADIVTGTKLDNFKIEYQGSQEEHRDLLQAFNDAQGKMNDVYKRVMMSSPLDDEERFRQAIDKAIEEGVVERFSAYVDETVKSKKARMNRAKKEAKEAEELIKEARVYNKLYGDDSGKLATGSKAGKKGASAEADLAAMIQGRQKTRSDNFLNNLEAKYTKGKKISAPPEEAFEKMAQKVKHNKKEREAAEKAKKPDKKRKADDEAPTPPETDDDEDENEDEDVDLGASSDDVASDYASNYGSEEEEQDGYKESPKKKAKTKVSPKKTKMPPRLMPNRKGRARVIPKRKA